MENRTEDVLEQAGEAFTLTDSRCCYGSEEALPIVAVETPLCRAKVALQGGQLLSFLPEGDRDWLWLSPLETFAAGKAIRGGVPICAPWFGVNRRDEDLPKHGFLRNRSWQLSTAEVLPSGAARLLFSVTSVEADQAEFPWAFAASLEMVLGAHLMMTLSLENRSTAELPLSFAFHSYFAVSSLEHAEVAGPQGRMFLDNCRGLAAFQQETPIYFDGEVDRVFEGLGGSQELGTGRNTLRVCGENCDTLIVWNPGSTQAARMSDVGPHFREFVCVERGAAFADEILLPAGEQFSATMRVTKAGEA